MLRLISEQFNCFLKVSIIAVDLEEFLIILYYIGFGPFVHQN